MNCNNSNNRVYQGQSVQAVQDIARKYGSAKTIESTDIGRESWLRKGHPIGQSIEMDKKLCFLLLGDGFIKNTPWEGYPHEGAIAFFKQFTQTLLHKKDALPFIAPLASHLQTFSDEMTEALAIEREINNIQNGGYLTDEQRSSRLDTIASKLLTSFREKQSGWIPCGWMSKNGTNHGMMAHVDMSGQVTLVNTGAGIETHHAKISTTIQDPLTGQLVEQHKYQEFVTYTHIDKERLNNKDFFKFLLELKTRAAWDGTLDFSSDHVYEPLKKFLRGKELAAMDPSTHPAIFKKGQRSGTCALKSVSTTLYYQLLKSFHREGRPEQEAVRCYKLLKYHWQTMALVSLAKQLDEKAISHSEKCLLEDVIDNVTRSAEKLYVNKQLTDKDLKELHCTLEDFSGKLSSLHVNPEPTNPTDPIDCSVMLPPRPGSGFNVQPWNLFSQLQGLLSLGNHMVTPARTTQRERVDEQLTKLVSALPDVVQFPELPETGDTLDALKRLQKAFDPPYIPFNNSYKAQAFLDHFSTVICKLPSPSPAGSSYWSRIPKEQVVPCMETVLQLMGQLENFAHISSQYKSNPHTPETTVMYYTLLAINTELARSLPESKLTGFTIDFYDFLYEMKSPHFVIKDARMQKQCDLIIRYFKPDYTIECLREEFDRKSLATHTHALFAWKYTDSWALQTFTPGHLQISKSALEVNQTVRFYKQFLDDCSQSDDLSKQLYSLRHPEYSPENGAAVQYLSPSDSIVTRLTALIAAPAHTHSLIPPSIQLLRAAAWKCTHLHRPEFKAQDQMMIQKTSSPNGYKLHLKSAECNRSALVNTLDVTLEKIAEDKEAYSRNRKEHADDKGVLVANERDLALTQNHLMAGQKLHFKQGVDVSRELEMLGTDPYDAVARCTAFIKNHTPLLKETEVQEILNHHLFRPERLLAQLRAEPAIINAFSDILVKAIQHYRHAEDFATCLSLVKLGNDVRVYVEQAKYPHQMADFREIIREQIMPEVMADSQMTALCYQTLVSLYENVQPQDLEGKDIPTLQMAQDILESSFYHAKIAETATWKGLKQHVAATRLLPLVDSCLASSPRHRNLILNTLIKLNDPHSESDIWTGGPIFFECTKYMIDLETKTIMDKAKGAYTQLPNQLLENPRFRQIFPGKILSVTSRNNKTFVINAGLGDELTITLPFDVIKMIHGIKYRYTETPAAILKQSPLGNDVFYWVCVDDNRRYIAIKEGTRLVASLHVDNDIDYLNYYNDNNHLDSSRCWIPLKLAPATLQHLNKIEQNPLAIDCWTNPSRTALTGLGLKNLGLSFIVKSEQGSSLLFSEQFPGYYLVANPAVPSLGTAEKFITLQNRAGARKVLVPRAPLTVTLTPSTAISSFNHQISQETTGAVTCLEYELCDGDLQTRKVEAQLYQCYLLMAGGDFNRALQLLKKITPLERFVNDEEENVEERIIIQWMISLLAKSEHPSAAALILRLALLINRNELKFPRDEDSLINWEQLFQGCQAYSENYSNTTTCRLDEAEERTVLDMLFKTVEKELKKLNEQLTQVQGPTQEAQSAALRVKIAQLYNAQEEISSTFSTRKEYLSTGKGKLGSRTVKKALGASSGTIPLDALIYKFNSYYNYSRKPLPPFLIPNPTFFETHFVELYRIATTGTIAEKELLQKRLDVSVGTTENIESAYREIIDRVMKHPSRYPTLEYLAKLKEATKKAEAAKLGASGTQLSKMNLALQRAELKYGNAINQILPSTFRRVCAVVHQLFTQAYTKIIGKFSIVTLLMEPIRTAFYSTFTRKSASQQQRITPCLYRNEASLHAVDQELTNYFHNLIERHFTYIEADADTGVDILPTTHPDSNTQAKLVAENAELHSFRSSQPQTKKIYKIKAETNLEGLKGKLKQFSTRLKTVLKTQQTVLLWQVNQIPNSKTGKSLLEIHKRGFRQSISWEDLRTLTLNGSLEAFQARTHLDKEDAERMMAAMSEYLIKSTRLSQAESVQKLISQVQSIQDDDSRKPVFLQHIPEALELVRAYAPDTTNLRNQWFEHSNRYLHRAIQLQKLTELSDARYAEILGEAPTGFGKTKNTIPNLNQIKAQDGHLVFNTWPASLEMTNAIDMQEQMDVSFGQEVDRLYFDRATPHSTESLHHLHEQLLVNKQQGRPVNIKSDTLRALELHLLVTLDFASRTNTHHDETAAHISYLIKILRLIRTESYNIIDEAHINLDPLDKLIYTMGDPVIVPDDHVLLLQELFENFGSRFQAAENQQSAIDMNAIAPDIAEFFRKRFNISAANKGGYEAFVLGTNGQVPQWISDHPDRHLIALVKGLLTQVLGASFKGSVDENYGLSKLPM